MILNNLHIRVKCASSGIYGDVVLDSIVNNTSSGGVRIAEDLSVEEVATLAREMTLKNSFWGLPKGGARGGIRIPSGICAKERRNILAEFGRRIAPLITTGIYLPWLDMNCGYEDLKAIYDGAGVVLGKPTDTAFCTALTVAEAMIACAEAAGLAERRVTVAIEGFGSVATHLAERLPEERFRIIAVSTSKGAVLHNGGFSPKMLVSSRKEHGGEFVRSIPGSTRIGREELLELEVDILVPSARTWAINDRNAGNVRARFI
ncbi:MAG: Glu/Leu/Phe/Val dehydrogenase dimerization domain-containing protein, partial [Nitrospirota bacterium]